MRNLFYFIGPLFVARIYALVSVRHGMSLADMLLGASRGFLADVAIGALAGLVFYSLRQKKYLYVSIWTCWVLLFALNVEHIKINFSNANFSFANLALAEDFILGSVLTIKNLIAFVICLVFSIPVLLVRTKRGIFPSRMGFLAAATAGLTIAIALVPASSSMPYWVQMNLLEENVRGLFFEPSDYLEASEIDENVYRQYFTQDLSGEPIIGYPEGKPNVLIILVEGISSYDVFSSDRMPGFSELAGKNLSYSNFIDLQHHTNKGVYSVVCGDYPNFLTREAKSDYVGVFGPLKRCLPEILEKNGYHTVFMQSANLGYMQKDRFAEKTGFSEIIGNNSYTRAFSRNKWGVDDQTLYLYAMEKIIELNRKGKPWFITLLTSGTHHPFQVPGIQNPNRNQAIQYADDSLKDFINAALAKRMFENTLVLITSDESSSGSGENPVQRELSCSHAPLVVLSPEVPGPMVHEEPFSQADILLSVADYIDIVPEGAFGRSIFRSYGGGRNLLFGNVYVDKIYSYFHEDETIYICSRELDCSTYKASFRRLFNSSYETAAPSASHLAKLKQALAYNELNSDKLKTDYVFFEKNREYTGSNFVIGDLKLETERGDRIVWRVKIKAIDDILVLAIVNHPISRHIDMRQSIFVEYKEIKAGDTFSFYREYDVPVKMPELWTKVEVNAAPNGRYIAEDLMIKRLKGVGSN